MVATPNWGEPTLGSNECGHALRHTYRTLAAAAGVPYDIAEMLVAHVLTGVGARYVHASEFEERLLAAQCQISAHVLTACRARNGDPLSGVDLKALNEPRREWGRWPTPNGIQWGLAPVDPCALVRGDHRKISGIYAGSGSSVRRFVT